MDFIEITILKWREYNPRSDVKKPSWFRFDNRTIENSDYCSWSGDHFKVLIYLFSQASQRNSDTLRISPEHAKRVCMIKEKDLHEVIQKLLFLKVIIVHDTRTLRERDVHDTSAYATLQDITLQDRTRQDITLHPNSGCAARKRDVADGVRDELKPIAEVIQARRVSEEVQKSWLSAYPDSEWVIGEVRKALAWEVSNGASKKNFPRFMNNWLSKAWDSRKFNVKSVPRNFALERQAANRAAADEYLATLAETVE